MGQKVLCVICQQPHPHGMFLLDMYICPHCEQAMLATEADDPGYHFFVERLKAGWLKKKAVCASV